MATEDLSNWTELLISLHSLLVIQREEFDDYDNQYVRKLSGPVKARFEESRNEVEIGQIDLWYIDGSRAADDELDIVDVCDSLGHAEYEYASALYTNGSVDIASSEESFSNDVPVVHALVLHPEYQGQGLEARIIWKIAQTIGYHCTAVVLDPEQVGISEKDDLGLQPTNRPCHKTGNGLHTPLRQPLRANKINIDACRRSVIAAANRKTPPLLFLHEHAGVLNPVKQPQNPR